MHAFACMSANETAEGREEAPTHWRLRLLLRATVGNVGSPSGQCVPAARHALYLPTHSPYMPATHAPACLPAGQCLYRDRYELSTTQPNSNFSLGFAGCCTPPASARPCSRSFRGTAGTGCTCTHTHTHTSTRARPRLRSSSVPAGAGAAPRPQVGCAAAVVVQEGVGVVVCGERGARKGAASASACASMCF